MSYTYDGKRVCVTCPDCGGERTVSYRQAKKIQRADHTPLCEVCRMPDTAIPLRPENYHQFWRSLFTQEEIDELWAAVSLYLDDERKVAA